MTKYSESFAFLASGRYDEAVVEREGSFAQDQILKALSGASLCFGWDLSSCLSWDSSSSLLTTQLDSAVTSILGISSSMASIVPAQADGWQSNVRTGYRKLISGTSSKRDHITKATTQALKKSYMTRGFGRATNRDSAWVRQYSRTMRSDVRHIQHTTPQPQPQPKYITDVVTVFRGREYIERTWIPWIGTTSCPAIYILALAGNKRSPGADVDVESHEGTDVECIELVTVRGPSFDDPGPTSFLQGLLDDDIADGPSQGKLQGRAQ